MKERKSYFYSLDLVSDKKICFSQLNQEEKEILSGYLLDETSKLHAYEYISEADYKDELPYMLAKYMITKNKELGEDILELMCENASNMMSNQIDELLNDRNIDYNSNKSELDKG